MHPDPDPLVPGYRSRFGGLWPDRLDAERLLAERLASRAIDAVQAERLRSWNRDGFVVLERSVPDALLDAVDADIAATWAGAYPRAHVEYWERGVQHIVPVQPEHEARRAKLLDMQAYSAAVRRAIFHGGTLGFLRLLFGEPPLAFQTLYFQRGTEQPMHQDTAYVLVDAPLELVGSWLALQDVREGSGELEYYVGSHRLPEHVWEGAFKGMPPGHEGHQRYLDGLHSKAAALGLERRRFRPRRGDLLLWHLDLAHGGSPITDPASSRRSLVTHYCPARRAPGYFRHHAHSVRLPDASGALYCYPCRWDPRPPDEVAP
jgi:hypothetical protein